MQDEWVNKVAYLKNTDGQRIAYRYAPGLAPTVVFLSGFRSDMAGNKSRHLAATCAALGHGYLCLDYRGHGQSEGDFEAACLTDWLSDAWAVIEHATEGAIVLVGSSMGGWIGLRVAQLLQQARPGMLKGFIGIAAAPDFTQTSLPARLGAELVATAMREGVVYIDSKYGDGPYPITRKLLQDGRKNTVMDKPLSLDCPVRLLHGELDPDVPWQRSQQLLAHMDCQDASLSIIKDGDHRLSEPLHLRDLDQVVIALLGAPS